MPASWNKVDLPIELTSQTLPTLDLQISHHIHTLCWHTTIRIVSNEELYTINDFTKFPVFPKLFNIPEIDEIASLVGNFDATDSPDYCDICVAHRQAVKLCNDNVDGSLNDAPKRRSAMLLFMKETKERIMGIVNKSTEYWQHGV